MSNISRVFDSILGVLRGYLTGKLPMRYNEAIMCKSNTLNIITILSVVRDGVLNIFW